VAIGAGDGTMRSEQWIFSFRVIEAGDIAPRFDAVAGLASEHSSIGAPPRHLAVERALMRVNVASSAASIFEVKWENLVGASG